MKYENIKYTKKLQKHIKWLQTKIENIKVKANSKILINY